MERKVVHVVPQFDIKPHDTDSIPIKCWCKPQVEQPCPSCDGKNGATCWRCKGIGWIDQHSQVQLTPTVVIHNKGAIKEPWEYGE